MPSKSAHPLADELSPSAIVRIARVLIGTTAEELAALVGALPGNLSTSRATRPIPSLSGLSTAIRSITQCYKSNSLGHQPAGAVAHDASDLGTVVRDYIALRSAWESREAILLAVWMTDSDFVVAGDFTAVTDTSESDQAAVIPGIRRRALVVDDSSDILIVAGAFLSDIGFDVVHAASAEAALLVLADGTPFDLLVTDYAMPGMNGKDLVVQAREQNPQLRALIISGYADSPALANLPAGTKLLAKPFRRAKLHEYIRAVIEHPVDAGRPKEMVSARPGPITDGL
jgi:CheY-like chemotaxis protein